MSDKIIMADHATLEARKITTDWQRNSQPISQINLNQKVHSEEPSLLNSSQNTLNNRESSQGVAKSMNLPHGEQELVITTAEFHGDDHALYIQ